MCNPGSTSDGVNCIGEKMAMYSVHFGFEIMCVLVHGIILRSILAKRKNRKRSPCLLFFHSIVHSC